MVGTRVPDAEIVAYDTFGKFNPIEVGHYPAGEPYIKETPITCKALIVRPKSLDTLLAALFLLDTAWEHHWGDVDLILPYFPGARQDKLYSRHSGDQLFTVRSLARIINNTGGVKTVKILDPHSNVIFNHLSHGPGGSFPDRLKSYPAPFVLGPYWNTAMQMMFDRNYVGVIAPDKGAVVRATQMAEYLEVDEVVLGEKVRDSVTGRLNDFKIEPPKYAFTGQRYLVVDDICDGGGTFIGLADAIQRRGVKADLFVTHGIFSNEANLNLLKAVYGTIYCSDSVLGNRLDGITVLPTVERML